MYFSDVGSDNNSALDDLLSPDEQWNWESADDEYSESEAAGPEQSADSEHSESEAAGLEQTVDSEHSELKAESPEHEADSKSNVPQSGNKRSLSESDIESESLPKKTKQDE